MIKYADKLYDLLLFDLRKYKYFDVIRIFEDNQYLNIHIITYEGYNITAIYYYTSDEYEPYIFMGIKQGFIKKIESKQKKLTVRDEVWLKRDFDDDAYNCYMIMKDYGDFSHLLYSIDECGGYYALIIFISSKANNEFRKLASCSRLDLSLENLALQKKYQPLFNERELEICYSRLHYFMNDNIYADNISVNDKLLTG